MVGTLYPFRQRTVLSATRAKFKNLLATAPSAASGTPTLAGVGREQLNYSLQRRGHLPYWG